MTRPHALLATFALCAGLFTAGPVFANGVIAAPSDFGWSSLRAGLDLRAKVPALRAAFDRTRIQPIATRADAPGFAGVKIWASGATYAVGRRSAGYGVQGGAALPLDEGIEFTASYRINGFALGDCLDPDLADVHSRTGAPFVGLDFEF
jgi:hypothetical protein